MRELRFTKEQIMGRRNKCIGIFPEYAKEDLLIIIEGYLDPYFLQAGQAEAFPKYRIKINEPMKYVVPIEDLQRLRKEGTDAGE